MARRARNLKIQSPEVPVEKRGLRFSLQFIQTEHEKFPIGDCPKAFFEAFFREILRYGSFTVEAFRDPCPGEKRHPIYFSGTTEPHGFPNIDPTTDDLWTDDSWQFGLLHPTQGYSGPWRIHGFISADTFYIVWLDAEHRLDP